MRKLLSYISFNVTYLCISLAVHKLYYEKTCRDDKVIGEKMYELVKDIIINGPEEVKNQVTVDLCALLFCMITIISIYLICTRLID